ncbi:hypothetical protein JTB14_025863 [Gonioctena quinquepunctata]|nr:hypothetical protein JTB14_025863 [Gonioctena quinquepunctata]
MTRQPDSVCYRFGSLFFCRSFRLKDATSLKTRPPLHCSTFPLVTCALLLSISYILQAQTLKRIALIILTAFLSHHTRDATRRGYWVFPFGSTPPIPYGLYVVLTCLIPYFICYLVGFVTVTNYKVINSSVI